MIITLAFGRKNETYEENVSLPKDNNSSKSKSQPLFEAKPCHGKWIAPPVGAKGEIMMAKPKKPKNRYQRDPVI